MMDQVATVLAGPGRLFCERLKAGISERQCRINEARARKLQEAGVWLGHLQHCLDCHQGEEVKKRLPWTPEPHPAKNRRKMPGRPSLAGPPSPPNRGKVGRRP